MNVNQIKSLGRPQIYYFQLHQVVEFISPVELVTGGWSFYTQSLPSDCYHFPQELQGPFDTEDEAIQAGFQYMREFEADLVAENN